MTVGSASGARCFGTAATASKETGAPNATMDALTLTGFSGSAATMDGGGAGATGVAASAAGSPSITMDGLSRALIAGSVTKDDAEAAALPESSRQRTAKMRTKADVLDAVTDRTSRPESGQTAY